ncbi:MAG: response regulator [Anaerolineales bacterium]|nr:response regulator [Anaerolineales bacterium]
MCDALLADDHAVVRAGLRKAMESDSAIRIVGEVGDGKSLEQSLDRLRPDLLVIDVAMPEFEPISAIRRIKNLYPQIKILVVSAYDDEAYVVGLLEAGVDGYHLKDQPLSDLQLAVQRVLSGERWISSPLIDRLLHRRPASSATNLPPLTRRQRELLRLISQGCDNRKISQAMELSVKTVENHLTGLYRVLGVDSRLEAMNYAVHHPEVLAVSGRETEEPDPSSESAIQILVVDDSSRYRQQLCRLIGKTCPSSQLYEAEDTAEAVRLAERIRPRLALVDVVLTDEDGIQCARRLKTIAPSTRIVLISAYPDREFRRLGLAAGAVALLDKKDLDAAAVRQVLEDALG